VAIAELAKYNIQVPSNIVSMSFDDITKYFQRQASTNIASLMDKGSLKSMI